MNKLLNGAFWGKYTHIQFKFDSSNFNCKFQNTLKFQGGGGGGGA